MALESFKSCLDMVMGNLLLVSFPEQGDWTRRSPEASSDLEHFVFLIDLWHNPETVCCYLEAL